MSLPNFATSAFRENLFFFLNYVSTPVITLQSGRAFYCMLKNLSAPRRAIYDGLICLKVSYYGFKHALLSCRRSFAHALRWTNSLLQFINVP